MLKKGGRLLFWVMRMRLYIAQGRRTLQRYPFEIRSPSVTDCTRVSNTKFNSSGPLRKGVAVQPRMIFVLPSVSALSAKLDGLLLTLLSVLLSVFLLTLLLLFSTLIFSKLLLLLTLWLSSPAFC